MTADRDAQPQPNAVPSADDEALLLLRLRGPLTPEALAAASGRPTEIVRSTLERSVSAGMVERRSGERHALSAAGGERALALLANERRALAGLAEVIDRGFAEVDRLVKEGLTDWQVVRRAGSEVPNDHRDARYDAGVLDRLAAALGRGLALVAPLAAARVRVALLCRAIEGALERARRGEVAYVCGLEVDSLHSLWWRLHGELLALLGRSREASG